VASAHGLQLWHARALHELGTIDQLRTESVDRLQQARELAVAQGALALTATLDLQIAAGLNKQFRADEALEAARRSADASRRFHLGVLPMALIFQATAHAIRGEREAMEARIADAVSLAPADQDVLGCAWGHCRATFCLLAGDLDEAHSQMTTGAGLLLGSAATIASRGNSTIIGPGGEVLAGPLTGEEGILYAEIDAGQARAARQQFDPVGHYGRPDVFRLHVDTSPRPAVIETPDTSLTQAMAAQHVALQHVSQNSE
jgi:ATP/maltotriose-dependent transcriptional regulator MalT